MDDPARLVRKRASLRSSITKMCKAMDKETDPSAQTPLTNIQLTTYRLKLVEKITQLKLIDEQVQNTIVDQDLFDKDLQESEDIEDKVRHYQAICIETIEENNRCASHTPSVASSQNTLITPSISTHQNNGAVINANSQSNSVALGQNQLRNAGNVASVKLPRINVEKFYGEVSRWQEFWSQYEVTIHKKDIDPEDKLVYLKSYLGGTALTCVSGLAITYGEAIEKLTDRFGKRETLIRAHRDKLRSLEPVKKSTDIKGLRRLLDTLSITVSGLQALKVDSENYGTFIIPMITELLPEDIVLNYSVRSQKEGMLCMNKLVEFLREEVESREQAAQLKKSFGSNEKDNKRLDSGLKEHSGHRSKPASSTFSYTTVANPTKFAAKCIFCKEAHDLTTCKRLTASERKEVLKGSCYVCLNAGHIARNCFKKGIKCKYCTKRHSHVVCGKQYPDDPVEATSEENQEQETIVSMAITDQVEPEIKPVIYLQTAWVKISNNGKEVSARCLIDTASQRTYITSKLSKELNLPVLGTENLDINSFPGILTKVKRSRVKFSVGSIYETNRISMEAVETPKIGGKIPSMPKNEIESLTQGKRWKIADTPPEGPHATDEEVSLLIGADFIWKITTGQVENLSTKLKAVDTIFGWTFLGPHENAKGSVTDTSVYSVNVFFTHVNNSLEDLTEDELVSQNLKSLWNLDSLGIIDKSEEDKAYEDSINEKFESTVKFDGERYVVRLPWKPEVKLTNDNKAVAERRFFNQLRKFRKQPKLFEEYAKVIETYLQHGMAELVDTPGETERTFYLPHSEVVNEQRTTTKVRVVFDGSSHGFNAPSVNDCLNAGHPLNVDLLGMLIKFRKNRIAFTADIEKAFLQVRLAEEDRDVTRFFWIEGRELDPNKMSIITLRMTRVLFGLNASPYLLGATIRHHIEKYKEQFPTAYKLLREQLYVDDVGGGADDNEKALTLATEAKEILKEAGMPLRKFQSNSEWLNTQLLEEGESDQPQPVSFKVLGIAWKPKQDIFFFEVTSLLEFLRLQKNTKRFVLQASSRIFDPVGFLSPFIIVVKCLFQELWVRGTKWDERIDDDLIELWNTWCQDLTKLTEIEVPRYYGYGQTIQIHCFTDASEKAYGAAIYIRSESQGKVKVILGASKSRVAPLKKLSVPKLELMAAVIGARLTKTVEKYFSEEKPSKYFWSDSTVTLSWIKSNAKTWKPFVQNRVSEIQQSTDPILWNHVPGKLNPADLLTRGVNASKLKESETWWKGPSFLWKEQCEWPAQKNEIKPSLPAEAENERRAKYENSSVYYVNNFQSQREPLLNLKNHSKLSRVIRVVAWIKRFVFNVRNKDQKKTGEINTDEILESETYWIKTVQRETFPQELDAISDKKEFLQTSKIADLKPFIDQNGILRMGGRLGFANLSFDEKHPIILPNDHAFTILLINKRHEEVMHMGVNSTLSSLRTRFWIPRGRQVVKTTLFKCLKCARVKSKALARETAPLPPIRVNESAPFENTGVDFCGPLMVKSYNTDQKRFVESKTYIALFTCAVTRAVHLEVVTSLSAEKFIMAFKRFVARRGVCRIMLSDNAKTFKKTEKELNKLWNSVLSPELIQYFGEKKIKWSYIVDRAPWWGGMWERMVGVVKGCLKKVIGRALLTYEELETLVIEAESVVNSRPVSYLYSDKQEPSPLTPSHFLLGKRLDTLPPRKFKVGELSVSYGELTKRWKYRQELLNRFWVRWRQEYLLELRSAQKSGKLVKFARDLKIGDVVILKDDRLPRHLWKLCRVQDLHQGRDGIIRSATLKTSLGGEIKRPLQLLYPIEISN